MANPYRSFTTDKELEQNGILSDEGDFAVLLARAGGRNQAYTRAMEKIYKTNKRKIDLDLMDSKVGRRLLIETFVETVIKGWFVHDGYDDNGTKKWRPGLVNKAGEEVEASKENILKLLLDEDLSELFGNLNAVASSSKNYLVEENEDDAKN